MSEESNKRSRDRRATTWMARSRHHFRFWKKTVAVIAAVQAFLALAPDYAAALGFADLMEVEAANQRELALYYAGRAAREGEA